MILHITIAQTLDVVVWGFQVGVGNNNDAGIVAFFDFGNHLALFVEQESRNGDWNLGANFGRFVLHRLFFHQAQDGQCQRLDIANGALA